MGHFLTGIQFLDMDESSCTNLYAIYHRPGHVKRPCYIGHKWQTKTTHQPSDTEERLLRVDPMWWVRSWTGRSGRSAGSGGDGPNTCSWSSNCCANCSSNLCNHLSKQEKLKTVDQNNIHQFIRCVRAFCSHFQLINWPNLSPRVFTGQIILSQLRNSNADNKSLPMDHIMREMNPAYTFKK